MKIIEGLIQGSPAWHAHRLNHFNASDAPAMMGFSPYKTRAELIREAATGLAAEVSAQTQRLFDDGHRTEALARPIAESIIGEELYPVTATNGALSASLDGLTMAERFSFECKRLNKRLREAMFAGCTGADLPMDYQAQMEHQHAVADPCERTLFIAAEFDAAGNLVEERHCWYTPNLDLRARILAGWKQFEADVAAYAPPAAPVPVVVAEPVQALPSVLVQVSGEIAIRDNFAAFETALRDFLEHRLIREPKTDQDFADLDTQIKAMKGAEAALDAAEAQMLAQIQTVDTAKKTKDMLAALVKQNRLTSEKLLESEKIRRKAEIVADGQAKLRDHCAALSKRVGVAVSAIADFPGVIKGKKSLTSMEDAIGNELASAKIEASQMADLIDANRKAMTEADADGLFPDFASVCTKAAEDFANLVASRRAAAQARIEAERARIRAEEVARLEREAAARQAQLEREQRAAAEQTAREEAAAQARSDAEARATAAREAADLDAMNTPAQIVQPVLKAEAATPDATDRDDAASTSPSVGSMGARQAADAAPSVAPAPEVRAFAPAGVTYVRAVKLGELCTLLGFTVTEAFLAGLGFNALPAKGVAKIYRHSDIPAICQAISAHVLALPEAVQQAA